MIQDYNTAPIFHYEGPKENEAELYRIGKAYLNYIKNNFMCDLPQAVYRKTLPDGTFVEVKTIKNFANSGPVDFMTVIVPKKEKKKKIEEEEKEYPTEELVFLIELTPNPEDNYLGRPNSEYPAVNGFQIYYDLEKKGDRFKSGIDMYTGAVDAYADPSDYWQGAIGRYNYHSNNIVPIEIKEGDYELKELTLLSDYKFDISFDWDYVPLQDYFSKTPSDGYSGAWTYMDRYISGIGYVWYFGDEASGYELLYPSDGYIRTEDVVEWEATYYLAMSEMVTITEDGETWEDYIDTSWPSNPGTTWYHYSYSGDFMSLFRGTVAFTAYFLGMADVYMEMRVDTERFISSGFLDNTVYGSVASSDSRGDYDEKSTYMFIYGAEKHNTSQDQIVYTEWATDSSGENSAYTNTPREDETWTEEFYIVVGSPIDGYYEFPLYDLGLLTADDYKLNLNPQVHCMRIYDYDGHPLYVYCYYTRHFQKYFYGYVYKGKHKQAEFLPTRVASQDYPRHDFFDSISEDSLYGYGQIRAALENGKYTEKRTYETD